MYSIGTAVGDAPADPTGLLQSLCDAGELPPTGYLRPPHHLSCKTRHGFLCRVIAIAVACVKPRRPVSDLRSSKRPPHYQSSQPCFHFTVSDPGSLIIETVIVSARPHRAHSLPLPDVRTGAKSAGIAQKLPPAISALPMCQTESLMHRH
jgi:hypothetical protein